MIHAKPAEKKSLKADRPLEAKKSGPVDRYARTIDYLRISVTDRCNLRCRYCMPEEGVPSVPHDSIMRYEEIVLLVRAAASIGFTRVRLTGGEPLVRKGLTGLIESLRAVEGIADLSLTTNGVLLAEAAHELREAGIDRVNVSLDTLRRDRFAEITRRDLFDQVTAGIDKALEVGMDPVKINVVVIRGVNDDEILDFALLTRDRPLSVRFIEFMPVAAENGWEPARVVPTAEVLSLIRNRYTIREVTDRRGSGPSTDISIDGFVGTIGFISPVSRHFCDRCNRLRVTSDGRIRGCLFSDDELYILPALRKGAPLAEIADLLKSAVAQKPPAHTINDRRFKSCQRSMSAIGG
jgi:cyclic pyranopterin phosphate synthase